MYKIKPGKSTAGPIKNNFKGTIQRFVASNNVISFMSSVIETQTYQKQFLYDALTMVKQLYRPKYFFKFPYADLRWEELPYVVNKLSNLALVTTN